MERWRAVEQTVLEFQSRPFEYGPASDCGAFWCAHLARIGWDVPLTIPGRTTLAGAKRALKTLGAKSMADLADRYFRPVAPLQTIVGDLAILPSGRDGWPACGIVGNACVHALGPRGGVIEMPRRFALKAWSV
jgi:hypothetical protein